MGITLLGEPKSRRTEFFLKAASALKASIDFVDICSVREPLSSSSVIKIDPVHFGSGSIEKLDNFVYRYSSILKELSGKNLHFLNEPEAILDVLDKKKSKELMVSKGIPVTRLLKGTFENIQSLQCAMEEERLFGVFIKPRWGSGAAGILAYRFQPCSGRQVLYTSARLLKDEIINTRKLRRLEDKEEIGLLLSKVLGMETVVEQWYPKAKTGGRSFDLRVIMQFGKMEYIMGRTSKGPITNLQLNNGAVPAEHLGINGDTYLQIEEVCKRAMKVFPGLSYAGIDVLLTQQEKAPYIIEVNGQGDLIYQDIFHENRIYKSQILHCMEGGYL